MNTVLMIDLRFSIRFFMPKMLLDARRGVELVERRLGRLSGQQEPDHGDIGGNGRR